MNYKNRNGPWMQLLSGKRFYPLDFRTEDIDIEDIAYGLGRESRYNGQYRKDVPFYSVAQHCVLGSQLIEQEYAFEFLMHDATEAYIKDIPKPLKILLPKYNEIETNCENIVIKKFSLTKIEDPIIKITDNRLLFTEKRDIMGESMGWHKEFIPFDFKIKEFWKPNIATEKFLERFYELNEDNKSNSGI